IITAPPQAPKRRMLPPPVNDDRDTITASDRVLLIVEDDPVFAEILLDLAREKGFKCVIAPDGETALALASKYKLHAITLDMILPDSDGWIVLDTLKKDPLTRHIPVHVITGDDQKERGLRKGAVAYFVKPLEKEILEEALAGLGSFRDRPKKLLIVMGDDEERQKTVDLLAAEDVEIVALASGEEALEHMRSTEVDCLVLDMKLPGMDGLQLLEGMREDEALTDIPVIVHSEKGLTRKEEAALKKFSGDFVIKDIKTAERLLDETALFLHRVASDLPDEKRQVIESLYRGDGALVGKRVLVVDDDVRNIFALTSVLERHQMNVLHSENGKDALETLKNDKEVDIVLMDIMMPEMDGYETTRAIRKMQRFKKLPIIALTAKAMVGDREKCIEAGASDYVTKPVDTDKLLSILRVWLYQ
ncbi:MAG TPA: response regulator, partial [Verrucomicrobiae bacterium]|nr:response regulator [Verrucomicrobiae bacterium]